MKIRTVLLITMGLASVIAGPITEDTKSDDNKQLYQPLSNSESANLDELSNKKTIQEDEELTETASKSATDDTAAGDQKVDIIIENAIPIEDIPTVPETQSVAITDMPTVPESQSAAIADIPIVPESQSEAIADIPTVPESQTVSIIDLPTVPESEDVPLADLSPVVEPQSVSFEDITVPESQVLPFADIPTVAEPQTVSMAVIPTGAEPQTVQLTDLPTVDEPQRVPLADISPVLEPQNEVPQDILEVPEPQSVFKHIRPLGNFGVQFSLTNYLYRNALASQIGEDLQAAPKGFAPIRIFKRKQHKQHPIRRFTIRRKFNRYSPYRKYHFGYPYYVFYRPSSLRFY